MRRLRILLSLLLCLTVPMAGWASLLSGPACPPPHRQATSAHQHAVAGPVAGSEAGRPQHQCGALGSHGKPCKGDHCACGCGIGACTAPILSLLTPLPILLLSNTRDAAVAFADLPPSGFARGTLPLRPPIC